jgi:hypothetical protein
MGLMQYMAFVDDDQIRFRYSLSSGIAAPPVSLATVWGRVELLDYFDNLSMAATGMGTMEVRPLVIARFE